jgi:hypothetical protein
MRRLGIVAVAAVCLLLTTGCRFAVVGDSVTSISRGELGDEGGEAYANGGVDIVTGRDAIRELAERGEEPIVIALGLMDTSYHATAGQIEARVRRVLRDDVADVDCVVWVDLKQTSNVHREWGSRSRTFNRVLDEVTAEFDRPVAHWSEVATGHDSWFREDGIHPNPVGQEHYARFIAESVDELC